MSDMGYKWNKLMEALNLLYQMYFPKSDGPEYNKMMLDALDALMQAYDDWLD